MSHLIQNWSARQHVEQPSKANVLQQPSKQH